MYNFIVKSYLRFIKYVENHFFIKLKLKNTIIICSHNDFDTNGNVFYNYLVNNGYLEKYKIVWLIKNKRPKNLPKRVLTFVEYKERLIKSYYLCTAKCGTFDDYVPVKRRPEQKWFYLTHGSLSLKNVKGKMDIPPYIDYVLFASEKIAKTRAYLLNMEYPSNRILYLGMPMDDIFYLENERGHLYKLTNKKYNKVFVWLPTFRKNVNGIRNDSNVVQKYGLPIISSKNDLITIDKSLSINNSLMIIKFHPMQDLTEINTIPNLSNIIILSSDESKEKGIDIYHLLKDSDALITDYSSIASDYMHVNKPIAFTCDDVDDYNLGIVKDFLPLFVGDRISTTNEMLSFIQNVENGIDTYSEKRNTAKDVIFKYSDQYSSKRLMDFIESVL